MKYKIIILFSLALITACERTRDTEEILKFYGDAKEDIGNSIAIADDGYIICGQLTEITRSPDKVILSSSKKIGIIKTGFDGNVIWKKFLGGKLQGSGSKIIVLENGSVVCTGQVIDTNTVANETDIFVAKLNSDGSGDILKIFPSPGNQAGYDILQTDEGFIVLGTTDVLGTIATGNIEGKKDILLIRIDNNLDQIEALPAIGFPGDDIGVAIKHDNGGGYIIAGTTDKSDPGQADNNIIIVKINADGSATEPAIIGGLDDEYAADIEVLDDGYIVAGTIGKETEEQSVYILKIPGNIYQPPIFSKPVESSESWSVKAMSRYKTNSFVLAGKVGTTTSSKMLIFIIDLEGNPVENKERITGSSGIQAAYDVVSDINGYIIAVGKNSYESNSMISLLKFRF
jgi:hypothetical protein